MKNNKGFSLVELIVVIAIMAILAAVAVLGISMYIPKAQQQADMTMLSDVMYGVEVQAYSETLKPGNYGYVLIKKAGGVEIGGDAAMQTALLNGLKATYGEDYVDKMKVAYPDWESATLDIEAMENITDSSFMGKTDKLLDKVQTLTNALKDYYGDGNGSQQMANEATLLIASNANKVNTDAFVAWWKTAAVDAEMTDEALGTVGEGSADRDDDRLKFALAAMYAKGEAFVQYNSACEDCAKEFNDASAALNNINKAQAMQALTGIMNAVDTHVRGCTYCGPRAATYFADRAETDAKAYLALMGQIDNMSEEIRTNGDMNSENLYTSDFVVDTIGSYENTADAFAQANPQEGDIMLVVTVDKDGKLVFKNYPMDY